ncbi:hypothetical protein BDQ17DRAFT_1264348, partial [Cyathus striatus]
YNTLLKTTIDDIITHSLLPRVLHISGDENIIADVLSRFKFDLLHSLVPNISISSFQPPHSVLGATKK